MDLAQRLSELATANSEGLLEDEEYRLLRQDLFERYNNGGAPAVSIIDYHVPFSSSSTLSRKVNFEPPAPPSAQVPVIPSSPPSSPAAKTSGFTSFLRRATSRKEMHPLLTTSALKRVFVPRKLSRKQSVDATSIRTTSSGGHHDAVSTFSRNPSTSSDTFSPPLSPTYSQRNITPPRHLKMESGDDIFEDGGLSTTKELRQFIGDLEEEGRRVMRAFDELENSTVSRSRSRSASVTAQTTTTILLTEMRQPSTKSTMLLPDAHTKHRHAPSDSLSVRSTNSLRSNPLTRNTSTRTSSSQSQPTKYSLSRKGSLSSLSSQGTTSRSLLSVRPGLSSRTSLSRSSGHLPLGILREGQDTTDLEEEELDPDILDIRRRRLDVVRRYESRLEYLRARLKGAELHEKLLKK